MKMDDVARNILNYKWIYNMVGKYFVSVEFIKVDMKLLVFKSRKISNFLNGF